MKTCIATVAAALVLGVAGLASSAIASPYGAAAERVTPPSAYRYQDQGRSTLGAHDGPLFTRCPASSAAEGNARQQNFPVKQYGQTSGGPLC